MFRNVLVAVDGSPLSDKAVEWAIRTCSECPETCFTFLFVHLPFTAYTVGTFVPPAYELENVDPKETPAYAAWGRFPDKDRAQYVVKTGRHAEMICATAEEAGHDLIVVGSQGHGLAASVLFGSVSSKVIHHAKCPVLVIR